MISVIIPTLNEAEALPRLLEALSRETAAHEILVVDGGSRDATRDIAASWGARVVAAEPGRGTQLRAGAEAAGGDLLIFLHADSEIGPGALEQLARTMAPPGPVGGNFRLVFEDGTRFARWLTGFYALIRSLGFYYGDSGIFVRRSVYREIGGFKAIALMEDYDFVRRLERAGETLCLSDPPLATSTRRFKGRHPLAIVWGWVLIHLLYWAGVSPATLARLYGPPTRP